LRLGGQLVRLVPVLLSAPATQILFPRRFGFGKISYIDRLLIFARAILPLISASSLDDMRYHRLILVEHGVFFPHSFVMLVEIRRHLQLTVIHGEARPNRLGPALPEISASDHLCLVEIFLLNDTLVHGSEHVSLFFFFSLHTLARLINHRLRVTWLRQVLPLIIDDLNISVPASHPRHLLLRK